MGVDVAAPLAVSVFVGFVSSSFIVCARLLGVLSTEGGVMTTSGGAEVVVTGSPFSSWDVVSADIC